VFRFTGRGLAFDFPDDGFSRRDDVPFIVVCFLGVFDGKIVEIGFPLASSGVLMLNFSACALLMRKKRFPCL